MTKEQIQGFSRRIAGCSRTELVVITYDIILTYIEEAEKSYAVGDEEEFLFNIKKAKAYVNDLTSSLNLEYSISFELFRLYSFISRTLFHNIVIKKPNSLENIVEIIRKLKASFEEVARYDNSGMVMDRSQTVYAGYTYSKGANLNEIIVRQ